jgi:hypothetical protein
MRSRAGPDARQEIQLALHEGEKLGFAVRQEAHRHGIEIRQRAALPVGAPVAGVALVEQHVALVPELEAERARAHRVLTEVLAILFHGLVRHHVGIRHGENAQERNERLLQVNAQRRVIRRHKRRVADAAIGLLQHLAPKNPAARAGRSRIENALERIDKVGRRYFPALATGKNIAVVEVHPRPQHERVLPPIR